MNKGAWWAWAIKNSISVICWTALAIIFNKWWIALFGLLFVSSLQTKFGTYRICDKCGRHSPYAESFNEAIDKAKEVGWITKKVNDKWEDYCPDCQKEVL